MSLLDIVRDTLEKVRDAGRVEAIDLRIGKLRAVVPENLEFCFEAVCKDTQFEGAVLRIDEIPVRVKCRECGEVTEKTDPVFLCTGCGSTKIDLLSGQELEIDSIEVED